MEDLQLSEPLRRYFSDVFVCCSDHDSGKATVAKTVELLVSANIPESIITQISDVCWTQSCRDLSRKQFFSALKLVATFQANLGVKAELLTAKVELPLPRFSWMEGDAGQDLIELTSEEATHNDVDALSTDSEVDSETLSIKRNRSPGEASSTASDSPTPTNSVQDRSWAVSGAWQGGLEEQRQLLGTEEESSDRHSSDEDTEVPSDVWTITTEQRDYYKKQFQNLQPDCNALLAGPTARMFFEKSRLPVHELRKIWQLADVTKDGALSLEEFNTAMHLVVLRRNNIDLPDTLPPTLQPSGNDTPLSVTPETEPILSPTQFKETVKEWTKFVDSPTSSVSSPGPKPVNFDFQKVTLDQDPKILHPVALRLTPEVASLQNDDQPDSVQNDLHSPKKFVENSNNSSAAIQRPQPKKINVPGPGAIPPPPTNASQPIEDTGPVSLPAFPPPKKEKPPPPPPRPFKTHGRSSSLDLNKLKLATPPTVPPRTSPNMQTSRRLINQKSEGDCGASTSETPFANFDDKFEKYENVPEGIFPGDVYEAERKKLFAQFSQEGATSSPEEGTAPRKHGAFEIYRKPPTQPVISPVLPEDKAKWELFHKLQSENTVLLRLCQELSQELADVREEKLALKVRLEKHMNGG